jgi:hypothetical protein
MLVRNQVRDFAVWKRVFDEDRGRLDEAGLAVVHLWRSIEDPSEVFFLLAVEDVERARAFTAEPASAAAGERAGVLDGALYYIEEAG